MLELIGFIALAYIIFKLAPIVLEVGFKFAVICLGLMAFIIIAGILLQLTICCHMRGLNIRGCGPYWDQRQQVRQLRNCHSHTRLS